MIKIHDLAEHNPFKFLNALADAPYDFYLCGSQLWGSAAKGADFDFYTEYSEDVVRWLEHNDFKLKYKAKNVPVPTPVTLFGRRLAQLNVQTEYSDTNTICVYWGDNIEVILVKDAVLRAAFQTYIIQNKITIPKGDTQFCADILNKLRNDPDTRTVVTEHRRVFTPPFPK